MRTLKDNMTPTSTDNTTTTEEREPLATGFDAEALRCETLAVRIKFHWLGTSKTLSADQKARAAEPFGAVARQLTAAKKLLDTSHPAYRAVTAVRTKIKAVIENHTLPFPEPGVRLLRQSELSRFDSMLARLSCELDEAVLELDNRFEELKADARIRLGELYREEDYPQTLVGLFRVEHDYPAVEPPEYLKRISPQVYEAERRRIAARFDEAAQLAEDAFLDEFAKLIDHLTERLGSDDGKPRVFRDSAIGNLDAFFDRFGRLRSGLSRSGDLDRLVEEARQALLGNRPQRIRDNGLLRQQIAADLVRVQSQLDGLMVDRPRRNIIRPNDTKAA